MSRHALVTRIKAIDKKLAETPINAEEHCIFKVHEKLLEVNKKAYKPVLLAIGPYNVHDQVGQGLMEEHKLRYLKQMLQRRNEHSVEAYMIALTQLEERARNCYAERIRLTKDEFVEMMLLDGCFIIELFCKWRMQDLRDKCDPIFQLDWMHYSIVRDLLLFENQLPFFVLTELFGMISGSGGDIKAQLVRFAFSFLFSRIPVQQANDVTVQAMEDEYEASAKHVLEKGVITHLLDLMHSGISFSVLQMGENHAIVRKEASFTVLEMDENHAIVRPEAGVKYLIKTLSETFKHISDWINGKVANLVDFTKLSKEAEVGGWTLIHSATELREAGVKFRKAEEGNIFGIEFNNGVLEVSPLTIDDNTETYLRNLIAYEQYSQDKDSHYATDYMCFLDDLINTPKDVEFLRRRGIIKNLLGDDEATSTMVNKLGHNVYLPYRSTIYKETTEDLKKHCSRRRHVWMAKLRHNYFNSPWTLLSFVAAVLLLLLSITQTTFTIIK